MEWESDSPCHSHTYPRQGHRSFGRHSVESWSLGILEQSQGKGCYWLHRDRMRGCEGGDCAWKCLWRKAGEPWKQDNTVESCLGSGAITLASLTPIASNSSWTIERLAHQTPDAPNYRAGPQPGVPSMCLTHGTTEKDRKGALQAPECTELSR